MKKLILLIAIIAAGAAWYWYFQSKKAIEPIAEQVKPLTGEWNLDTVVNQKQSKDLADALMRAIVGDMQLSLLFTDDATCLGFANGDTTKYHYQQQDSTILLTSSNDTVSMRIQTRTDTSMIWYYPKDSATYYWKIKQ